MIAETKIGEDQARVALDYAHKVARVCTEAHRDTLVRISTETAEMVSAQILADLKKTVSDTVTFPEKEKHGFICDSSVELAVVGLAPGLHQKMPQDEFVIYAHHSEYHGNDSFIVLLTNQGRISSIVGSADHPWLLIDEHRRTIRWTLRECDPHIVLFDNLEHPTFIPLEFIRALGESHKPVHFGGQIKLAVCTLRACRPRLSELHDLWLARQEVEQKTEALVKLTAEMAVLQNTIAQDRLKLTVEQKALDVEVKAFAARVESQTSREQLFNEHATRALTLLESVVVSASDTPGSTPEKELSLARKALGQGEPHGAPAK